MSGWQTMVPAYRSRSPFPAHAFSPMLADLVVILHFAFVLFVILGGLLVLRWPRLAYVHLPVALYGTLIELVGWICPLTPLEKRLRESAGLQGYQGGFVEHYILPVLYPAGLTREVQWILGMLVVGINLVIYAVVARKRSSLRGPPDRLTA
ncbi:MAG TPA: DUF2784 domain-containing protein [Gemmatimonadales bacterium]|nr:DUF2784 domain-containing protein [Gemmatimonadales bacterium]